MKGTLHIRNKHSNGYDFDTLVKSCPMLRKYVKRSPRGQQTIDFSDSNAVKMLNQALLISEYNVKFWDLPEGHLCPPIPGRVDYIHYIADLLFEGNKSINSDKIKGLDIGTGANLIYPILGHSEYGWKFVGSEINLDSVKWANELLTKNPNLTESIKLRRQKNKKHILKGLIKSQEKFDFTICNPPFHASEEEAIKSNHRKSKNLGLKNNLNFGGVHSELWCDGGEVKFIELFLEESIQAQTNVLWFTCLVSKKTSLDQLLPKFKLNKQIKQFKVIEMSQGQKISRFIAWTFFTDQKMKLWKTRWK